MGAYVRAGLGAAAGTVVAALAVAALFEYVVGSPTIGELVGFDHDGALELEALALIPFVGIAVVVGAPVGCWLALRAGRAHAAGRSALLVPVVLGPLTWVAVASIPSSPSAPVLEPYAIVAGAAVAGLAARAAATARSRR